MSQTESIYEVTMLVETRDGKKNVMSSKIAASSYEDAKNKSYYAARALGYDVLRFIDATDNQEF